MITTAQPFVTRKIPILNRTFFFTFWVAVGLFGATAEAQPLNEAAVIAQARAIPSVAAGHARVGVAEAQAITNTLYPNPTLAWNREAFVDGEADDFFWLQVPIDVSGRRNARGAIARSSAALLRSQSARIESQTVVTALQLFYAVLGRQEEVRIAQETVARLEEAARVLRRRFEEGTAAGYEQHRLELATEVARSQLRLAEAQMDAVRRELAARLGLSEIAIRGTLAVAARDRQDPLTRPSVASARSAASEAREAGNGAASAWVPSLAVTGGLRLGTGDETQLGYVAGVSLNLPLFSRGQGVRAAAAAQATLAAARAEATERQAQQEWVRANASLRAATEELERFIEATEDRLTRLERAAATGYQEGRRTIVELLDVQEARRSVELRRLSLRLMAKLAEVALRAAEGEFE
ncbi:MAG: TolC family protein [Myxococcota bacterium]